MPGKAKLIVNTSSPLYKKTGELIAAGDEEKAGRLCRSVYSLATLAHRQLTADELKAFLQDQYDLLAGL
jgi:hypothetical protein